MTPLVVNAVALWLGAVGNAPPSMLQQKAALHYRVGPGATQCPSKHTVEAGVTQRLGYSPWDAQASRVMEVHVFEDESALKAQVVLRQANGVVLGTRWLESSHRDCQELSASLTLALTLVVDPLALAPSSPATRSPQRVTATAPQAWSLHPPTSQKLLRALGLEPLDYLFSTRVGLSTGSTPNPTGSWMVGAGLGVGVLSLRVEARLDFPSAKSAPEGWVQVALARASLVPCWTASVLQVCALGTLGTTHVGAPTALALSSRDAPYTGMAGRFGLQWALWPPVRWTAGVDAEWNFTRLVLREKPLGATFWQAAPLGFSLQTGVEIHAR